MDAAPAALFAATVASDVTSGVIWVDWNQAHAATSAVTFTVSAIWKHWNLIGATDSGIVVNAASLQATPTEYEARRVARVLADEADKKAEAILLQHLSEEQRRTYRNARYFELITKKGRYRLYKGWSGNVARISESEIETDRYCIHPAQPVPEADNLLAQKLMLELEEERFLKVANRTAGRRMA